MHNIARKLTRAARATLAFTAIACLVGACGDDSPPRNQIITAGNDAGDDASDRTDTQSDSGADAAPDVVSEPACDGIEEGGSCVLENAIGVCVRGACRFLTCENGFRNCDGALDNGCEADVTVDSRCGTCSTTCSATASCQLSSVGFTCATTPVCQEGRIDLDGDTTNGCEFLIDDRGPFIARAGDIDVTAGDLSGDTFWFAGENSDGALVGSTGADEEPETFADADSAGPSVGLVALPDDDRIVTAWRGGLSASTPPQSSSTDQLVHPECVGPLDEHQLTGIDRGNPDLVSASHALFEHSAAACESAECLRPAFDRIDYLRAYYPYSSTPLPDVAAAPAYALPPASLSSCDTCFLDATTGQQTAELGCLGDTVCASETSADCAGCQPNLSACPDFEPIAVQSSEPHASLVVVTRSGVLVLRADGESWAGGPRAEGFLGDVELLQAAVAVEGDVATVFMLGDDARIYVARVDLTTDGGIRVERAPIEVAIPLELASARLHAASHQECLVSSRSGAVLIRSTPLGSVQAPIPAPEATFDTQVLVASGYDRAGRTYGLLYSSLRQLTLRTVSLQPAQDDASQ